MGEITIEIPKSNAAKSAEDTLVDFVLKGLREQKAVQIIQRTFGYDAGNWAPQQGGGGWHDCSYDTVDNVIRAFRRKGYIVREFESGRYPTRHVTFIKE